MKKISMFILVMLTSIGIFADTSIDVSSMTSIPDAKLPVTLNLTDSGVLAETFKAGFKTAQLTDATISGAKTFAAGEFKNTHAFESTNYSDNNFINNALYFFYYAETSTNLNVQLSASEKMENRNNEPSLPWSVEIAATGQGNSYEKKESAAYEIANDSVTFKHASASNIASYACYNLTLSVKEADYLGVPADTYTGYITINVTADTGSTGA